MGYTKTYFTETTVSQKNKRNVSCRCMKEGENSALVLLTF